MNNRRLLIAAVFHFVHPVEKKTVKNITSWHKTVSASAVNRCQSEQVSRCCINFPHDLTCQILTNQSTKIGRRAWPTRDLGKKMSSPPVFLNNWLTFRVRGYFEIKLLIVRGHSDINTTYFIWIVTLQRITSKKYWTSMGRQLSPRYGQVILVSRYLVLTSVNWSQHWCAISFLLGSQRS